MKRKILAYSLLPLLGIGVFSAVYAASGSAGSDNPMSSLVTAIAEKFNLNESEVQAVFDEQRVQMQAQFQEQRAEMEAEREQNFTDQLSQAVSEGELTQEQANAITAKRAELELQRTEREEERRTAMEQQRESLQQWAEDNNIPEEYLGFVGFGMHRGGRLGGPGLGFGPCSEAISSEGSTE